MKPRTILLGLVAGYSSALAAFSAFQASWTGTAIWFAIATYAFVLLRDGYLTRQTRDDLMEALHGNQWVRLTARRPAFLAPISHYCRVCGATIEVNDPSHLAEVFEFHQKIGCVRPIVNLEPEP